jgi:alpha-tubulin suppressor-like RCC1 family protein
MNKPLFIILLLPFLLVCTRDPSWWNQPVSTLTIYEPGGERPAAGVVVKFFKVGAAQSGPCALDTTDEVGQFPIDDLPVGKYDIWAEKDSLVLFQGASVISPAYTTVHDDTLKRPSSLTGVIALRYSHDPCILTIRVEGTDKLLTISDEQGVFQKGAFTVTGLTGGTWTIVVQSTLPAYLPSTKTVFVGSGSDDTLADTLRLFSTEIPFVEGVRISQDTLAGTIRLSWKKAAYVNSMDYAVYRASCSDVEFPENPAYVAADTFLVDSIRVPAASVISSVIADSTDSLVNGDPLAAIDSIDTVSHDCFKYRIALRTREGQIGPAKGYGEIQFARRALVTTYLAHRVAYPLPVHRSASIHDTVALSLFAKNPTRRLRSLCWYDPVGKDTIATVRVNAKEIRDTLRHAFDSIGANRLIAVVVDDAGDRWADTVPVTIVEDAPVANAGNDTGVFVGTPLRLHGSATDSFGGMSNWAWKIGTGTWGRTAGPDTEFVAPSTETTLVCSLAVIDDDGNRAADEVLVFTSFKVERVAASLGHIQVLKSNGVLWTSGNNEFGELGDGSMEDQKNLVPISTNVKSMSTGAHHTLILTNDGTLWGFGDNSYGQLGDGINLPHPFPVPVMNDVQSMSTASYFSLMLKTDGSLWACGDNEYGQLGDSTQRNWYAPVRVMPGVKDIAAGDGHSVILKTDGTAWTCGLNSYGQLGIDSLSVRFSPAPHMVMPDVMSVFAGFNYSLFLKKDRTLWGCGANGYGQLGDGTTANQFAPVRVNSDVQTIIPGTGFALTIKTDGTLWVNGRGYEGQWGTGKEEDTFNRSMVADSVKGAAASRSYALILKTDGSLWRYEINQISPVRIIPFTYLGDEYGY